MWVVNDSSLNAPRDPIEGCVAVRTPHLVTSRNLEDHSATCGTRLRILIEHLDGLNVIGVALVILTFVQLITMLTNLGLAEFALPLVREETAADTHGTLPDEGFLGGSGINTVTRAKPSNLIFELVLEPALAALFHAALLEELDGIYLLLAPRNQLLGLWEEAPFPLNQHGFAVGLEILVAENLGTVEVDVLTVPGILTAHTVRVVRVREEVALNAFPTTVKITELTLNLCVILEVVGFTADCAVTHLVTYQ